jgi:serine/threonine-protein kinase
MGLTSEQVLSIDGLDEILEVLDESGQKQVFIARAGENKCAVKSLHIAQGGVVFQNTLNRATREIDLINRIESDYTPKLGPIKPLVFKDNNDYYLVYSEEYIPGKDVSQLISENYFQSEQNIRKLISDVTKAIKVYWYEADETVHRDVKPQNIRLNQETNKFVLIDAGIAYVRNRTNFTPTGFRSPGTPGFMAPEHLVKGMEFSFKTDLYCLGVVAYLVATNNHPTYDASLDDEENDQRVVNVHPAAVGGFNTELPQPVSNLIMKMLEKQPHKRPRKLDSVISIAEEN